MVQRVNSMIQSNRPQIVAGSVIIVLDESSKAALIERTEFSNKLGEKCVVVFGPTQAAYDKEFAPMIGRTVSVEITSMVYNETTEIAFVRLPEGLNGPKVPYIVVSLAQGVSKESASDLLQYADEEDTLPLLVLTGTIEFAPAMGSWVAERDRRVAARAAETGPDAAISQTTTEAAPGFAAEIGERLKADPALAYAAIDCKKVIGSRGRYNGCPLDVTINLADYYCTDKDGPRRKRQYLEAVEGAVEKPTLQIGRRGDGSMSTTSGSRSIAAKRPAGWMWESKNSKNDGSLRFVAIMEFNPALFARLGYFQGKEHRVAEVGGVKFNLFDLPSRDTPFTGVYKGEVKVRINEYRHSTDRTKNRAVPRFYVNGNRVDRGGPKPTHRLYLLSVNEEAPAGAIVLRGPGQAQIVLERL